MKKSNHLSLRAHAFSIGQERQGRLVAAVQTTGICIGVEAVVVLVLGTFVDSYLGAAGVSLLMLGPISCWLAPSVYSYFLRTHQQ